MSEIKDTSIFMTTSSLHHSAALTHTHTHIILCIDHLWQMVKIGGKGSFRELMRELLRLNAYTCT